MNAFQNNRLGKSVIIASRPQGGVAIHPSTGRLPRSGFAAARNDGGGSHDQFSPGL
jgi:hypothetical protein